MPRPIKYLAYGSNLHPDRLRARIYSARFIRIEDLLGYRLMIHKRGIDGSAKCNAFYTGDEKDKVLGALYEIDPSDKPRLDHFEDEGQGYEWTDIGGKFFTYLALNDAIDDNLKPFDWYKELVLLGMKYHHFPKSYRDKVQAVVAMQDDDLRRAEQLARLIERLKE